MLQCQSSFRRQQLLGECKGSRDLEVDLEVWKQTLEEISKGLLVGPLEPAEVPNDAPISERFGLRQRHKVRLIDGFSEPAVNQTVLVYESRVLHTVDVACAAMSHWFGLRKAAGASMDLLARAFDLSSAYRQVGLNHEGRQVAYIRVFDP